LLCLSSSALAYDWTQDENCVGAWLYAEGSGTTVADSSPNTNTGNFKGDGEPAWVGSVTGTNAPAYASDCTNHDGTDDWVSYGTGMDNLTPFSYTVWLNPDAASSGDYIYSVSATEGGGGSAGMWIGFPSTYDLTLRIFDTASANYINAGSVDSVTTGAWKHVAVTWDGTTNSNSVFMYVNGVDLEVSASTSGGTRRSDATYYKYISGSYDGKLTENAIFSAVLDSTDINDIMDNGLLQAATARRRMMIIQ